MTNPHHAAIRNAQVADLDSALAVLRAADEGALSGVIRTVAGLRQVLATAEDMTLPLLVHNSGA